jgi:hypothetical protein
MANVKDVLKRKIGVAPVVPEEAGEAPEQGPETDDKAEVSEAAVQNPTTATPTINAEHIVALAHMTIANQTALMQLVEILRPVLAQHGQVVQAMEHMIPQHVAMVNHLAGQVPPAPVAPATAPIPSMPPQGPVTQG